MSAQAARQPRAGGGAAPEARRPGRATAAMSAAALLLFALSPTPARADEISDLKDMVRQLDARIKALEAERGLPRAPVAAPAVAAPTEPAAPVAVAAPAPPPDATSCVPPVSLKSDSISKGRAARRT